MQLCFVSLARHAWRKTPLLALDAMDRLQLELDHDQKVVVRDSNNDQSINLRKKKTINL
jgi:hypothetical protein